MRATSSKRRSTRRSLRRDGRTEAQIDAGRHGRHPTSASMGAHLVITAALGANISNLQPRRDVLGRLMDVHDGQLSQFDGRWFWIGMGYGKVGYTERASQAGQTSSFCAGSGKLRRLSEHGTAYARERLPGTFIQPTCPCQSVFLSLPLSY